MSKGHNKKRNVGLIYEQVINKASAAMMDGGPEHAKMHISFLKKHFAEGTELLKELYQSPLHHKKQTPYN